MSQDRSRIIVFIALGALFLVALCVVVIIVGRLFMQPAGVSVQDPNLIYTAAAQTVQAQLTQSSGGGTPQAVATETAIGAQPTDTQAGAPTSTEAAGATSTEIPTSTALPTNTAVPTNTSVPATATPVPIPCDWAYFVKDVTYPDNTEVAVGTTFVKTWRLKNIGSCTWTSSYSLVFYSGDAMSGPASSQLTSGTVPPGSTIDVSVTLKAPDATGTYRGDWKLRNASGALFGIGDNANTSFWVKIKAVLPVTPTPAVSIGLDFISQGQNAIWSNNTQLLSWGDQDDDSLGVAAEALNRTLDDGRLYPRTLATFPEKITDGLIRGVYPPYMVRSGDHFRTALGLKDGCEVGKVRYVLSYMGIGGEVTLAEWVERCDDKITNVDIDLTALKGQLVQFILTVKAEGSPSQDYSYWVSPRIEK